MRATAIGTVLGVLLLGCGGSSPTTGDDQHVTERPLERVRFELSAELVGDLGGPEQQARDSLKAVCDAWVAELGGIVGAEGVESFDCGAAREIGGSDGWAFASTGVAHVVVQLPEGDQPLAFEPGAVSGETGTRADAIESWRLACSAEIARQAKTYGSRLLGAACAAPKEIGNGGYRYTSPLKLWIAPTPGTVVDAQGYVFGTSGPEVPSHLAWRGACDDWLDELAARSGARFLGAYSCGDAKESGQNGYLYTSETKVRFTVPLVEGTSVEATPLSKVSGTNGTRDAALASWRDACRAALDEAKAAAGKRFLVGVCHTPKEVGSSGYQYESAATVWTGDVDEAAVDAPPEPAPTDPTDPGSPVAADCSGRCVAMMNACDAGPVDQTCEAICAYKPSEAKLSCAEQTSCEHLEEWSTKCHVFE